MTKGKCLLFWCDKGTELLACVSRRALLKINGKVKRLAYSINGFFRGSCVTEQM